MTTIYYVGSGGNDGNDGLSWANRKLTLNAVEDIPVIPDSTVYVGAGTYREMLTVDVDGSSGSPITYIGDYTGANTDGVGGVVRITGSDDDVAIARDFALDTNDKNYRTFQGFLLDLTAVDVINAENGSNTIIDKCYLGPSGSDVYGIRLHAATNSIVQNCYFNYLHHYGIRMTHATGQSDTNNLIQNCIFNGCYGGVNNQRMGGVTVKNCKFLSGYYGIRVEQALPDGQVMTVNNSIFTAITNIAVRATIAGELVENYNCFYKNGTNRTNVNTGANSNTYPPLFDSRWFFESVK